MALTPEDRLLLDPNPALGPRFLACIALPNPPSPNEAWIAYDGGATAATALARAKSPGRGFAFTVERLGVSEGPWPEDEPATAAEYRIAVGEFLVLAPSLKSAVPEPREPTRGGTRIPHIILRVAASSPKEAQARRRFTATGFRVLLGRVHAIIERDEGWELLAIIKGASGWSLIP